MIQHNLKCLYIIIKDQNDHYYIYIHIKKFKIILNQEIIFHSHY